MTQHHNNRHMCTVSDEAAAQQDPVLRAAVWMRQCVKQNSGGMAMALLCMGKMRGSDMHAGTHPASQVSHTSTPQAVFKASLISEASRPPAHSVSSDPRAAYTQEARKGSGGGSREAESA
jgi:hypothetical protein